MSCDLTVTAGVVRMLITLEELGQFQKRGQFQKDGFRTSEFKLECRVAKFCNVQLRVFGVRTRVKNWFNELWCRVTLVHGGIKSLVNGTQIT